MVMWTKSVDIDPDALSQSVRVRRLLPNDARSLRALWMAVQSQGAGSAVGALAGKLGAGIHDLLDLLLAHLALADAQRAIGNIGTGG